MAATLDHLIAVYGVLAVFLGAGLEGEAVVTTAGVFAHRGVIDPFMAALAAALGSFLADQLIFFFGRSHRDNRHVQRLLAKPAAARAIGLLHKYPDLFCISFRFIYGLRIVGPLTIGVSQIPARRFVLLNFVSASVWGSVFVWIGYRFGHLVETVVATVFGDRRLIIAVAIIAAVAVIALILRRRNAARED